jgi:DNA-binding NtrC family response regulator
MSLANLKTKLAGYTQAESPRGKAPIVIVDDDEQVLRSLRIILQGKFDVHLCSTADVALRIVQSVVPHTVVLDVKMPEHDGFWVMRQIRTFNEGVPIILNSAYQDDLNVDDALASHRPFAYLSKSDGSMRAFIDTVDRAVRVYQESVAPPRA